MANLTLARPAMTHRLRGIAHPVPPVGSSPSVQSRLLCAAKRRGNTPITRSKMQRLGIQPSPVLLGAAMRGIASTTPKPPKAQGKTRRRPPLAVLTIVILGLALFAASTDAGGLMGGMSNGVLNGEAFVPYKVVSAERISPTTFVLTVSAPAACAAENAAVISRAWAHGLWSVEVKQPQLQIARNYTPLPPAAGAGAGAGAGPATLRFLIRRYAGGETSTYLSRLRPGDEVWLRGPRLGFDVARRLGDAGARVVFLAGGTGVAPALQAARHLLSAQLGEPGEEKKAKKLSMEILWANRARADCAGCPRLQREAGSFWRRLPFVTGWTTSENQISDEHDNPIVQELRAMQSAYQGQGHEMEFKCVADDEFSAISSADIVKSVEGSRKPSLSTIGTSHKAQAPCYFHSQRQLQNSTQESDAGDAGSDGQDMHNIPTRKCSCGGKGANGKNLLMVSGPDGFVNVYVGPKVWAEGAERQGPVGGLVRKLMERNPEAWRGWLILKQ